MKFNDDHIVVDEFSFPVGVMTYEDAISRQFLLPSTRERDCIGVTVGEVHDPSKFWMMLQSSETELNSLMDELQLFYCYSNVDLIIPSHVLREGLYCAVQFDDDYHRAVITELNFNVGLVKVFYIDYGTSYSVDMNTVSFLHKKFSYLPAQAIRARLADIWPPVAFSPWSIKSFARFLSLVKHKSLVARICQIDTEREIVEVFLKNTNENIDISDALVKDGLAFFTHQKQKPEEPPEGCVPKYKHAHLHPSFDDLETGYAASIRDILLLEEEGVNHMDNYFYKNIIDHERYQNKISSSQSSVSAPLSGSTTTTTNPQSSPKLESFIPPVSLKVEEQPGGIVDGFDNNMKDSDLEALLCQEASKILSSHAAVAATQPHPTNMQQTVDPTLIHRQSLVNSLVAQTYHGDLNGNALLNQQNPPHSQHNLPLRSYMYDQSDSYNQMFYNQYIPNITTHQQQHVNRFRQSLQNIICLREKAKLLDDIAKILQDDFRKKPSEQTLFLLRIIDGIKSPVAASVNVESTKVIIGACLNLLTDEQIMQLVKTFIL